MKTEIEKENRILKPEEGLVKFDQISKTICQVWKYTTSLLTTKTELVGDLSKKNTTYLDVRRTVCAQINVEAVAVVVSGELLVDQNHPMMLYSLARLNDGTNGR